MRVALDNVVAAAARVFRKVIVLSGPARINEVPSNVVMLPTARPQMLRRRISCVVHHGGIGSLASFAALRVPQVLLPGDFRSGL